LWRRERGDVDVDGAGGRVNGVGAISPRHLDRARRRDDGDDDLALVRQIAEVHGGTVSVASAPGHGASFIVWLPDRRASGNAAAMADLRTMADPLWSVDEAS